MTNIPAFFGGDKKEVLDILCSIISVANKANVGCIRVFFSRIGPALGKLSV